MHTIIKRFALEPILLLWEAQKRFAEDEGFVLAGNIAFSSLLAFFPFLIFLTALAGFLGNEQLATNAIDYLLSIAPVEIVGPISGDIHALLTEQSSSILTFSIAMTIIVAAGGVESIRKAFNRAYSLGEFSKRPLWLRLLQNLAFVIGGAFVLIVLALLLVIAPLGWQNLADKFEPAAKFSNWFHLLRLPVGLSIMFFALYIGHALLPRRPLRFRQIWPGILLTMLLWLCAANIYAIYTAKFSRAQFMYAGLGNVVIALLFVYISAALVIWGAEFNEVLIAKRAKKQEEKAEP